MSQNMPYIAEIYEEKAVFWDAIYFITREYYCKQLDHMSTLDIPVWLGPGFRT